MSFTDPGAHRFSEAAWAVSPMDPPASTSPRLQTHAIVPRFYMDVEDAAQSLMLVAASTLSTEPAPQPS